MSQPAWKPKDVLGALLDPQHRRLRATEALLFAENLLGQRPHGNCHHLVEGRMIIGRFAQIMQ